MQLADTNAKLMSENERFAAQVASLASADPSAENNPPVALSSMSEQLNQLQDLAASLHQALADHDEDSSPET